jgi:hypothetical protein
VLRKLLDVLPNGKTLERVIGMMKKLYPRIFHPREYGYIIVFQMGKVGSSTIYESLKSSKFAGSVFHVHHMTEDVLGKTEKIYTSQNIEVPRHLRDSRFLLNELAKDLNGRKWAIISLVREPIARNISAFFQNIELPFPDFNFQNYDSAVKIQELVERFLQKYPHDIPLRWFDRQMKPVFGIDVYESDFPKTKGYKIYRGQLTDLLVVRLESLTECAEEAFGTFLNMDQFVLLNANTSNKKNYYNVYRKFVDSIKLPSEYIEKMYSSKYVQHFYTEEEICHFLSKWKG